MEDMLCCMTTPELKCCFDNLHADAILFSAVCDAYINMDADIFASSSYKNSVATNAAVAGLWKIYHGDSPWHCCSTEVRLWWRLNLIILHAVFQAPSTILVDRSHPSLGEPYIPRDVTIEFCVQNCFNTEVRDKVYRSRELIARNIQYNQNTFINFTINITILFTIYTS